MILIMSRKVSCPFCLQTPSQSHLCASSSSNEDMSTVDLFQSVNSCPMCDHFSHTQDSVNELASDMSSLSNLPSTTSSIIENSENDSHLVTSTSEPYFCSDDDDWEPVILNVPLLENFIDDNSKNFIKEEESDESEGEVTKDETDTAEEDSNSSPPTISPLPPLHLKPTITITDNLSSSPHKSFAPRLVIHFQNTYDQ